MLNVKSLNGVALISFLLLIVGLGGCAMAASENLNGARGKIFQADVDQQHLQLLKETVFDPKTDEGRSRHTVYWTDQTRFIRVDRQNTFEGLKGDCLAHIRDLSENDAQAAAEGRDFVCLHVTILAPGEDGSHLPVDKQNLLVPLRPDPQSDKHRGAAVTLNGKQVPVRLRGPRAEIDIRSNVSQDVLRSGFWETRIFGARDAQDRFVATRIELYPRIDPRTVDDPHLPRVLVVGDSISMNYHEAAKAALKGIANYDRVDGNGGPSDRGVACMELWLGDYKRKGLRWDVIQFNHGLHDLKQFYDENTKTYGKYQVPIEEYKANLEKEISIMEKTGATLVWCATTPVPSSSVGRWKEGLMGRQKGADLIFNQAAMEVMSRHPEILINDLNATIRKSDGFEPWWKGTDVHFRQKQQQEIVGKAVAEAIKKALVVHAQRHQHAEQ